MALEYSYQTWVCIIFYFTGNMQQVRSKVIIHFRQHFSTGVHCENARWNETSRTRRHAKVFGKFYSSCFSIRMWAIRGGEKRGRKEEHKNPIVEDLRRCNDFSTISDVCALFARHKYFMFWMRFDKGICAHLQWMMMLNTQKYALFFLLYSRSNFQAEIPFGCLHTWIFNFSPCIIVVVIVAVRRRRFRLQSSESNEEKIQKEDYIFLRFIQLLCKCSILFCSLESMLLTKSFFHLMDVQAFQYRSNRSNEWMNESQHELP